MKHIRKYGQRPYNFVVVHGGPGAPGSMAPVASEISKSYGVLEPFQTMDFINGQIAELKEQISFNASSPVTLIGHSWGAWLSYIFAANFQKIVKKLIIINCGCFDDKYLSLMNETRNNRLSKNENEKISFLYKQLVNISKESKAELLQEFGKIMNKADSYCSINYKNEIIDFQPEVFKKCMGEINIMRSTGNLIKLGNRIRCPVVAIHGENDPHPYLGVKEPLSKVIQNFSFFLISRCGHSPWYEKYAKKEFFDILKDNL